MIQPPRPHNNWLVACQFHPEMMSTNDENAKRLFTAFVKAAQENITK